MYHSNIVGKLTPLPYPSFTHWASVKAAWWVSLDLLHNASLLITLTVSEVVNTDNWVTSTILARPKLHLHRCIHSHSRLKTVNYYYYHHYYFIAIW